MLMEYLETCPPQPGDRIVFSGPAPGIRLCDCDFAAGGPFAPGRLGEGRFEAVFCRSGRLTLALAAGRSIALGPGEMLLVTCGARLTKAGFSFGRFSGLAAGIEAERAGEVFAHACAVLSDAPLDLGKLREILQSHGGVMRLREEDWNAGVFAAFRQLSPDRQGGYFVYKLIELLYLLCGRGGQAELPPGCYYDPYQVEAVRKVQAYMVAHSEERLTIAGLTRKFQLSPTFLKACFRQLYGESVHAYLQRYRLQRAAYLLATTRDSVLTVASKVGYAGTSRFGAAFKELYHMTPAQYRRVYGGRRPEGNDG